MDTFLRNRYINDSIFQKEHSSLLAYVDMFEEYYKLYQSFFLSNNRFRIRNLIVLGTFLDYLIGLQRHNYT